MVPNAGYCTSKSAKRWKAFVPWSSTPTGPSHRQGAGHAGYAGAPIACLTSSTSSYINPASLVARIASQLHGWCGQVSGQSGGSVPSRELGSAAWRECCSRWITDKTVLRIFWRRKLAFTSHYYPASRHARSRCSFESFSQTSVRCPSGLFAIVIGPEEFASISTGHCRTSCRPIFSKVEWPLGYGPGECPRVRGWVEPWLSSKIRVFPPLCPPQPSEPTVLPRNLLN